MSDVSTQKPDMAFQTHREIIGFAKQAQAEFLEIAKRLHVMKESQLFKQLDFRSFNEYLHDSEMPFPATLGHALVKTYEQLILKSQMKPETVVEIGQTKATIIARAVEKGLNTDMDTLVAEAGSHPVHVLRQRVNELMTGVSIEVCEHDDNLLRKCKKCFRIEYVK